jgi:hypothetical protein
MGKDDDMTSRQIRNSTFSVLLCTVFLLSFQNCSGFVNRANNDVSASSSGPGDGEPVEGKPFYDYTNPDKICAENGSHLISKLSVEPDDSLNFVRVNCATLATPLKVPAGDWQYGAADHSVVLYKGQNYILEGAPDPCATKTSGAACTDGNGQPRGYFVAANQGANYMITPSLCNIPGSTGGCWNVTNEVVQQWEPMSGYVGVTSPDGLLNSWMLEKLGSGAAQKCRQMDYGGFTDWYLPSAAEMLAVLVPNAKSVPGFYGDPNSQLPPVWSSTELGPGQSLSSASVGQPNDYFAYALTDSGIVARPRNAGSTVRCIRRY